MSPQRDDLQNEFTVLGLNCGVLSDLINSLLDRSPEPKRIQIRIAHNNSHPNR